MKVKHIRSKTNKLLNKFFNIFSNNVPLNRQPKMFCIIFQNSPNSIQIKKWTSKLTSAYYKMVVFFQGSINYDKDVQLKRTDWHETIFAEFKSNGVSCPHYKYHVSGYLLMSASPSPTAPYDVVHNSRAMNGSLSSLPLLRPNPQASWS